MDTNALILRRRSVKITTDNLPKFIKFKIGHTCMRLITRNGKPKEYWRDGGCWGMEFYIKDGRLYSNSYMDHLKNKELVPVTEEEWRKCNGQYAPNDI